MNKTNRKNSVATYLFALLLLSAMAVVAYYAGRSPYRSKKFRYSGFGIYMPPNYLIHGIDVSHYQSLINWTDVKQMEFDHIKIGFCFIKATEGTDKVDDNYIYNWREAKQLNIPVGAYHFFYAGVDGNEQAQNFMAIADLKKNDLPPVLDVEQINETSDDTLQHEVQNWLDAVQKNYHVKPIIYTNIDFYEDHLEGKFDNYPLWIANFLRPDKPAIERNWLFWQHSETGHANGIGGYVDFNVFNGDSTDFQNLLLK